MMFVGSGALLARAIKFTNNIGMTIDAVCCPPGDHTIVQLKNATVSVLQSNDLTAVLLPLSEKCADGIAFSINNQHILEDRLLNSGLSFFNIHNGLTQFYRGIAEVCIFAAICEGAPNYGTTLHKVLPSEKVDSGPVVSQIEFGIGNKATFSDVMSRSLAACQMIFESNVERICSGAYELTRACPSEHAYSYKDVPRLCMTTPPDRLSRARVLGEYSAYFPRLQAILETYSASAK
jgi:folate-dependent phosphoribosylglycinamide formyltransferase PurN